MLVARRVFLFHRYHLLPRREGLLLKELRGMSELAQAGQVRTVPDSEVEIPEAKKVRLDNRDDVVMASASLSTPAVIVNSTLKKKERKKPSKRKSKHKKSDLPEPCSPEDVLWHEIKSVLGVGAVERAIEEGVEFDSPFTFHQEVDVIVKSLSPGGEFVCPCYKPQERKDSCILNV